ncbi:MAG TPA: hypothetical protein VN666_22015 [Nitrospira sp.]|nr:hypothetical protein [Nitrospira sp.]
MKDYPDSFWAMLFIVDASILASLAMFSTHPGAGAVITMASSIITGAFGYIQGKKAGEKSVQVPLNPDPASTTSVTINPTPAAAPPKE